MGGASGTYKMKIQKQVKQYVVFTSTVSKTPSFIHLFVHNLLISSASKVYVCSLFEDQGKRSKRCRRSLFNYACQRKWFVFVREEKAKSNEKNNRYKERKNMKLGEIASITAKQG